MSESEWQQVVDRDKKILTCLAAHTKPLVTGSAIYDYIRSPSLKYKTWTFRTCSVYYQNQGWQTSGYVAHSNDWNEKWRRDVTSQASEQWFPVSLPEVGHILLTNKISNTFIRIIPNISYLTKLNKGCFSWITIKKPKFSWKIVKCRKHCTTSDTDGIGVGNQLNE